MTAVRKPAGVWSQLHVVGQDFKATVSLCNGRVVEYGSMPAFKRLANLTEAALRSYAAERGWTLEPARVRM